MRCDPGFSSVTSQRLLRLNRFQHSTPLLFPRPYFCSVYLVHCGHSRMFPVEVTRIVTTLHILLQTCSADSLTPCLRQTALPTASMNLISTPPVHPRHEFTQSILFGHLPTLLMRCFNVSHQNLGSVLCKCGTNYHFIGMTLSFAYVDPIGNPP